jgi:hypothetical protein
LAAQDPIEEEGGINLYGFLENDGIRLVDVLGYGFWSTIGQIIDVIPIIGTFKNLFFPPNGIDPADYNVKMDLNLCEADPEAAKIECQKGIRSQLATKIGPYIATMLVHDFIDVSFTLITKNAWWLLDGAIDSLISMQRISKMIEAANDAMNGCNCPATLACNKNASYDTSALRWESNSNNRGSALKWRPEFGMLAKF